MAAVATVPLTVVLAMVPVGASGPGPKFHEPVGVLSGGGIGGGEIPGVSDVACASPSVCFAVGQDPNFDAGEVLRTSGATSSRAQWTLTSVAGAIQFNAIACPSAEFCLAGGESAGSQRPNAAVWNGTRWTDRSFTAAQFPARLGIGDVQAVACGSPSHCVALLSTTSGSFVAELDGASWSTQLLSVHLSAVQCPSPSLCVAVGPDGGVAEDHSGVWTVPRLAGVASFDSISCYSTEFCTAVGSTAAGGDFVATFDGTRWSSATLSGLPGLSAVACPSIDRCVAVGSSQVGGADYEVVLQGTTWSGHRLPGRDSLSAIQCLTPSSCVAVGSGAEVLRGGVWRSSDLGPGVQLRALDCASATSCLGGGDQGALGGLVLNYDGTTWRTEALPRGVLLVDVSCASTQMCVAVGVSYDGSAKTAVALEYTASGWRSSFLAGAADLEYVDCVSVAYCVAVGQNFAGVGGVAVATYDGTSWTVSTLPDSGYPTGLSCPTTTFCLVAGDRWSRSGQVVGDATVFNGSSWTVEDLPQSPEVNAVDCVSSTECVAVGSADGAASLSTMIGTGWKTLLEPSAKAQSMNAVSCPIARYCVAVGTSPSSSVGATATFDGVGWTATSIPGAGPLESVDCVTPSFCAAVGTRYPSPTTQSAVMAVRRSTQWSASTAPTPSGLTTVSCPSTTVCLAFGGTTLERLGGDAWTASPPGPYDEFGRTVGAACFSIQECLVPTAALGVSQIQLFEP